MNRIIHKANLPMTSGGSIYRLAVPAGTKALAFANQHEEPAVWYERYEHGLESHALEFMLVGTGIAFPSVPSDNGDRWTYMGTAQFYGGNLVLHCYTRS